MKAPDKLDLRDLPNGLYLLHIISGETRFIQKIIKQ
jgi:hypothetical protein